MQGLQPLPQHWDGEGSWGLRASQSCSFPLIVCKTQALHQKQHSEEWHVLISQALFGEGLRNLKHLACVSQGAQRTEDMQANQRSIFAELLTTSARNARHRSHQPSLRLLLTSLAAQLKLFPEAAGTPLFPLVLLW